MDLLLFVRGIEFNKHSTSNYVLISIYILNIDTFGNVVKVLITRKIYLINNLKAKILIKINTIGLKAMDISIIKKKIILKIIKRLPQSKLKQKNSIFSVLFILKKP